MMQTDAQPEGAKAEGNEDHVAKAIEHIKATGQTGPKIDALITLVQTLEPGGEKPGRPQSMGDAAKAVAADVKHDCAGGNCCGSC